MITLDTKLNAALNTQVANWSLLYTKLHRYHWYVTGPHFFTLHEKFEELYNEATEVVDEIAERILTIGGKPVASMKEYLEVATLKENLDEKSAEKMVENLISDYQQLRAELKEITKLADEEEEPAVEDYAVGLINSLDKHIWMLNAYLG